MMVSSTHQLAIQVLVVWFCIDFALKACMKADSVSGVKLHKTQANDFPKSAYEGVLNYTAALQTINPAQTVCVADAGTTWASNGHLAEVLLLHQATTASIRLLSLVPTCKTRHSHRKVLPQLPTPPLGGRILLSSHPMALHPALMWTSQVSLVAAMWHVTFFLRSQIG